MNWKRSKQLEVGTSAHLQCPTPHQKTSSHIKTKESPSFHNEVPPHPATSKNEHKSKVSWKQEQIENSSNTQQI